jgi:hypothetical protein
MNTPPALPSIPVVTAPMTQLESHLRTLRILHFVMAGLTILGIGFLCAHYFVMTSFLKMPMQQGQRPMKPEELASFMTIMRYFYLAMGGMVVVGGILNLLVAIFIGSRSHRIFCLVVSGFNCMGFPMGTALGVFTIMTLTKPEAVLRFEKRWD